MENVLDLEIENNTPDTTDLEGEVYVAGTRGYSAYEVAVRNGYVGTEQEWLASLVGATPDFEIGDVETGETASATITGTPENPILNLILPKGDKGDTGLTGNGISKIELKSQSGLTDTYRVTYTNGTTYDYQVKNGKGITSIVKTGTSGLVDTYTITYNDGTTSTYTITNGKDGEDGNGIALIEKTGTSTLVDTYTITYTDGTTSTFTVTNAKSISSITKIDTTGLIDTYRILFNDGTTFDYEVTNGNTITNVEKISTVGLADTYRISTQNGTTYDFTITNGEKGDKGNVMFATFDIVNGDLIETYDSEYSGINFNVNNNGELEVII